MDDFLDILAADAIRTINNGYYEVDYKVQHSILSLRKAIEGCVSNPVISEIKRASPSLGALTTGINPAEMALKMEKGGTTGISVLTEPVHFKGEVTSLREVREAVEIPILMKDIVVDPVQVEAAVKTGADAVLLIKALFDRGHCLFSLDDMIGHAHSMGLEVLLETHTDEEFKEVLESDVDLLGINNRNLSTLQVDLNVTMRILKTFDIEDKIIVSESGIRTPLELVLLRDVGARAFLIGSALMQSNDICETVRSFVLA